MIPSSTAARSAPATSTLVPVPCAGDVRFDPWEHVRATGIIVSVRDDLPNGFWGATDGQHIWLNARLGQLEARCTLTHELVHLYAGHSTRQPKAVEDQVRLTAALWLLPDVEEVLEAARWARSWAEWAQECSVDEPTIRWRMRAMSAPERKAARAAARVGFSA